MQPKLSLRGDDREWVPVNSEAIAGRVAGPKPPPEWASVLRRLVHAARFPEPPPPWWTIESAYYGSVETRTDPSTYFWDGMRRPFHSNFFCFQFTLAGFGQYETEGRAAQLVPPGRAFFSVIPSRHRYFLPERSPGWTFGWFAIHHPYLVQRISERVRATEAVLRIPRDSPLMACAVRLVIGALRRDFHDRFELEQALFQFLFAYERFADQSSYSEDERARLLEELRARLLEKPRRALRVETLAKSYGMSRSHFSHLFKARTGLTPARFATQVRIQEAADLLLHTRLPIKEIADSLGFADANHFCKVFRRVQHLSPGVYRKSVV